MTRQDAERRGRLAEWLAAALLTAKGYRLLARRFRGAGGEIDLIARKGRLIVFVEVKARKGHEAGILAVTAQTRRRIEAAAGQYMARNVRGQASARYDIVTLAGRRLRHHRDAWRAGD